MVRFCEGNNNNILLTAIGLSPGGSDYFTYKQSWECGKSENIALVHAWGLNSFQTVAVFCGIWGSHSGVDEDLMLLDCYAVLAGR
jgi:hypothetical protein